MKMPFPCLSRTLKELSLSSKVRSAGAVARGGHARVNASDTGNLLRCSWDLLIRSQRNLTLPRCTCPQQLLSNMRSRKNFSPNFGPTRNKFSMHAELSKCLQELHPQ